MRGNGKVFISHTHEDNQLCAPLLAALDAWGVDYWFDVQQLDPGQHISQRVQQAIAERDVFIRIGTANSRASMWTMMELAAFQGLQVEAAQTKSGRQRFAITLVLDPAYLTGGAGPIPGMSERTDVVIDATTMTRAQVFARLRAALDLAAPRQLSRRGAIGLGAAAAVSVAAASGAGVLIHGRLTGAKPYPKPRVIPFANSQDVDPRMRWYFTVGSNSSALALDGETLYVNSDDGFYALNASDGSVIWYAFGVQGNYFNTPVPLHGAVYATGGLGKIYALNARDGSQLWTAQPSGGFADGLFATDSASLYVLTDDGYIKAYRLADGALRWTSPSLGKIDSLAHPGPAVGDGLVYVGYGSGRLYALSTRDGSLQWTFQAGGLIGCIPTVADGMVYFGCKDGNVYAVGAADGTHRWTFASPEGIEVDVAPTVVGGVAYIGLGINLYALAADSGKQRWMAPAAAVDQDGNVASADFSNSIDGQVTVSGGVVYACAGTDLFAFPLAAHDQYAWRFTLNPSSLGVSATPVVGNGSIFVGADNHRVYAVKAS